MRKRQPRYRPNGNLGDLVQAILDDFSVEECAEFLLTEGAIDEATYQKHIAGLADGTIPHDEYRREVKAYAAST